MIDPKLLAKIQRMVSDAAFGYAAVTNAVYNEHVRALLKDRTEREKDVASLRSANEEFYQANLALTEKILQMEGEVGELVKEREILKATIASIPSPLPPVHVVGNPAPIDSKDLPFSQETS